MAKSMGEKRENNKHEEKDRASAFRHHRGGRKNQGGPKKILKGVTNAQPLRLRKKGKKTERPPQKKRKKIEMLMGEVGSPRKGDLQTAINPIHLHSVTRGPEEAINRGYILK